MFLTKLRSVEHRFKSGHGRVVGIALEDHSGRIDQCDLASKSLSNTQLDTPLNQAAPDVGRVMENKKGKVHTGELQRNMSKCDQRYLKTSLGIS